MGTKNVCNISSQGVVYYNGTGSFSGIDGGTSSYVLTSNGTGVAPSFQLSPADLVVNVQTFTASGTYTPTSGMKYCIIQCIGGGGGGAGVASTTSGNVVVGGCGGGGEMAVGIFSSATIGASQTVTIGSAGAAGNTSTYTGGDGGTTSVGSLITCGGGHGASAYTSGSLSYSEAGAGGSGGSGGFYRTNGTIGGSGIGITGLASSYVIGWNSPGGGSGLYGGGAPATTVLSTGSASTAGSSPTANTGAGGSGGLSANGGSSASGGAGAAGVVIITEYV